MRYEIWKCTERADGNLWVGKGEGDTLADAIRAAGIRCETCKHWREIDNDIGMCNGLAGDYIERGGFCCDHSNLQNEESN